MEPPWEGEKRVSINGPGHMTNQSQILCGTSLGRGKESIYKWSMSHDQDGRHTNIYGKPSKIFSYRTNSPMIMKLCMEHCVLKLYKVYINENPELTLTYFTIMSNLAKIVFCTLI